MYRCSRFIRKLWQKCTDSQGEVQLVGDAYIHKAVIDYTGPIESTQNEIQSFPWMIDSC